MEDAYVIGIRLALENGVSAGIATISRELAALDGAIATTTAHLQRLEQVAEGIARGAAADLPRIEVPGAKSAPVEPTAPVVPPTVASPGPAPLLPPPLANSEPQAVAEQAMRGVAPPAAPQALPSPSSTAPQPALLANSPSAPAPLREARDETSRLAVSATASPLPSAATPPRPATSSAMSRVQPPREVAAPPPTPATVPPAPQPLSTGKAPAAATPPPVAPRPAPVPPPPPAPVTAASSPAPRAARIEAAARSLAPPALPPPPAARPISSGPAAPTISVAPPRRDPEVAGPTHGDVFLDGARVGTWLSDHLARAAAGPQSGGTGVDPTLTPAWPGTLQGQ